MPAHYASSESNEWHTPPYYVAMARQVMGSIDLDPASCAEANKTVQAANFFKESRDGLVRPWYGGGNVWLNPPYGRGSAAKWSSKLIEEYEKGHVKQAILLVPNSTDTHWFQPLWEYSICFVQGRIKFQAGDGQSARSNTKGSVFVYFGINQGEFADVFGGIGHIVE